MATQQSRFKTALTVVIIVLLSLVAVWVCHHLIADGSASESAKKLHKFMCSPRPRPSESPGADTQCTATKSEGSNTLVIYAGRWKFLRISFPYVYRELRKNGGVLDRVRYMMMNYDNETHHNLVQLTQVANRILKKDVFELRFMGYTPGKLPPQKMIYTVPYYELFAEIIANNSEKYFKMDDDIVYIHPGTFKNMIESKNSQQCFLHFGNIVTNWRSNIKHQELGVYETSEKVNPKNLKFEFSPSANCGWKSPECAELTVRTFLHYYHQGQLDKYQFDGLELLNQRKRYSINLVMLDKDVIDIKALQEVGVIQQDDEQWWTVTYSGKFKRPNCIVGRSFVVHFSYRVTSEKIFKLGFLSEFESIVQKEVGTLMEKELWDVLKF